MIKPALFDVSSISVGPKTRALQTRSLIVYGTIFVVATLLIWLSPNIALKNLGLGLVMPGGGFLLWVTDFHWHGLIHLGLFLTAVGLFGASVVLWFATGNAIGPPLVWLGTAVAASMMPHDAYWPAAFWMVPIFALGFFLSAFIARTSLKMFGKRSRKFKNNIIANAPPLATAKPVSELTLADLQLIRSLLDRALQPLEKFSGFEPRDQYQTAALRYQLNFAGYALSMYQANHAPAFQAYLTQAQKNLILKQQDPRIWNYWKRENAWGNFQNNADPMAQDNIMFTGFVATQIAMFQAASNSNTFNEKASLQFVESNGQNHAHDFPDMVETLIKNFHTSELGLIACEPNWVYPLCNTIGAVAVAFHNPKNWRASEAKFRHCLDTEFLAFTGSMVPCRSIYTGLALPSLGGTVVQSLPCFFLNATAPDLAMRHWLVERDSMLKNNKLRLSRFWPVDVGNYRFSRASSFAATAVAAVELGDQEVADLLLAAMDNDYPSVLKSSVRHRPNSSLWAHGAEVLARTGKKNGFSDLINRRTERSNIHIADAPYPDVLVASAKAGPNWLHAVFYANDSAKTHSLKLAGLAPHRTYAINGQKDLNVNADVHGYAIIRLLIAGRTELRIELME